MRKIDFTPQPYKAAIIRLFAAFAALEGFRQCHMRLCFRISDQTGLSAQKNTIFLLLCVAVVAGMLLAPLMMDRTRISGYPARLTNFVRACAAIAACAAVAGFYTNGYTALSFQFATTVFTSCALAVCLRQMTKLLPPRRVGLAIGLAFAVAALSGAALFSLPFVKFEIGVILTILGGFLLIASLCFNASRFDMATKQMPVSNLRIKLPSKRIMRLFLIILCLFVIVDGLFDTMYAPRAPFGQTLNYTFFILLYAAIVCIAAGFAFERINVAAAMICAFVLIGVGQTMSFFSQNALIFYPYMFSNMGDTLMGVILISLPVAFCAFSLQKSGILPGLGYILLYGGSFLIRVGVQFSGLDYIHLTGAALIASIVAIIMIICMVREVKAVKLRGLEKEFSESLASSPLFNDVSLNYFSVHYCFTTKETEILRSLVESKSPSAIAEIMAISEKAVLHQIRSMLAKTGVKTRLEMMILFKNATIQALTQRDIRRAANG